MTLDGLANQVEQFVFNGGGYGVLSLGAKMGDREEVRSWTEAAHYSGSGVVFSAVLRRIQLFSQAMFRWQRYGSDLKPMGSDFFYTPDLDPLQDPMWLLTWAEVDVATTGNAFLTLRDGRLHRLDPRNMTIVLGSKGTSPRPGLTWDAVPIGYIYQDKETGEAETFTVNEVAHWAPYPDPDARFRGMSYLRPVLLDSANDRRQRQYMSTFYDNGATPYTVVTFPTEVEESDVEVFQDLFLENHQGVMNNFKTAFLGGGADIKTLGSPLKDLDSEHITSTMHATICAAAGVPPILVGVLPGLDSSTLANYQMAVRSFADFTVRHMWGSFTSAIRHLFPRPSGGGGNGTLAYTVTHVSALQEDAKDQATVMSMNMQTIRTGTDGGLEPDTVIQAVTTGDFRVLKHTGLLPVQMQPPGAEDQVDSGDSAQDPPASDGGDK
jgi:hypothetical protein